MAVPLTDRTGICVVLNPLPAPSPVRLTLDRPAIFETDSFKRAALALSSAPAAASSSGLGIARSVTVKRREPLIAWVTSEACPGSISTPYAHLSTQFAGPAFTSGVERP